MHRLFLCVGCSVGAKRTHRTAVSNMDRVDEIDADKIIKFKLKAFFGGDRTDFSSYSPGTDVQVRIVAACSGCGELLSRPRSFIPQPSSFVAHIDQVQEMKTTGTICWLVIQSYNGWRGSM